MRHFLSRPKYITAEEEEKAAENLATKELLQNNYR